MTIARRLAGGLVPAVPVPFRGKTLAADAQHVYARWMATQDVAGVAVWAHTGRGPHLSVEERRVVLQTWRAALPNRIVIAGASNIDMAKQAKAGGADALLAFPEVRDPVGWHATLGAELPVIAFYLYEAAGGVAYSDATLHAILALPEVVGIKVATLDSVMTFQRIVALVREHPGKLVITGEDRFLGYSLMLGAESALVGMASAQTDLQCALLKAHGTANATDFLQLSGILDRFSQQTFIPPMEGYVQRMLWAMVAEGVLFPDASDDPWGPSLPHSERGAVIQAVQDARAARR
jgi:4-hydroxy-tetrahydrodipicolinate synthase